MKCFAQALDLKDDPVLIEQYKDWHRRVYPEVVASLRGIGITRLRIFLHGTRLFMYLEAPDDFDPATSFQKYAESPRAREWNELMKTFQRQVPDAPAESWWTPMEQVFDLESC